jgi:hypothetical protein
MKSLFIILAFALGSFTNLFSQAQIDWGKVNPNNDSAMIIEYKDLHTPEGMHNMRMQLFSISDSHPIGIILENNQVKKFILLIHSTDPAKINDVENQLKSKFPGPELVLTPRTIAQLQAEYGN